MAYEAKSTTLRSRGRKRTETAAIELLSKVRLSPGERQSAMARIRRARQPGAEVRRIISQASRRAVEISCGDVIDLADVQELRVKLIRRDGRIVEPHASLLHRLDARIAARNITRGEFEDVASQVWAMPQALPRSVQAAA